MSVSPCDTKIIIAIDGFAGTGKSTTAKIVAHALGYTYIDSGAMYRAVTLYFLENNIELTDPEAVKRALQKIHIHFEPNHEKARCDTFLNNANVEADIRTMRISQYVSDVSKIPQVRQELADQQRRMGMEKGIVMDGRDIGTRVFPEAELKIFMTADMDIRARRRQVELSQRGEDLSLEFIVANLKERDLKDTQRAESPLRQADDAIPMDSTKVGIDQLTQKVVEIAKVRISELCTRK